MGFIKDALRKAKLSAAEQRKLEELLHEIVDDEMQSGDIKRGLWTKALAEADGDEKRAGAKYIPLRVQSLTDEMLLFSDAIAEAKRRRQGIQVPTEPEAMRPAPREPESGSTQGQLFDNAVIVGFSVLVFFVFIVFVLANPD